MEEKDRQNPIDSPKVDYAEKILPQDPQLHLSQKTQLHLALKTQLHLLKKEINNLKKQKKHARTAKCQWLGEVGKAKTKVVELTQKLKTVTESKIKATEVVQNKLKEANGDNPVGSAGAHKQDMENKETKYVTEDNRIMLEEAQEGLKVAQGELDKAIAADAKARDEIKVLSKRKKKLAADVAQAEAVEASEHEEALKMSMKTWKVRWPSNDKKKKKDFVDVPWGSNGIECLRAKKSVDAEQKKKLGEFGLESVKGVIGPDKFVGHLTKPK
ncbi:uncharacterized protein LOC131321238 [Rhododendron vialii]|uniref:uncharacterized protein LOC131321238 n=1 Tax=Rhododendron vialii TaxID=182163 RepID=UPI00265EB2FD|nr:uncharacterized protein LOC131321238 [Rhododendron vialii]